MLEDVCGWSREVDWGNAPSWAAVAVAAIVGLFTINNVRTASKAYQDGKWDTKVSQARRVYAHVKTSATLAEGSRWSGFGPASRADHVFGRSRLTDEQDRLSGQTGSLAREDLYAAHAEIVNNSDEPVGDVVVEMHKPDGSVIASDHSMPLGVLNAGESKTARIFVPFPASPTPAEEDLPRIVLRFTDSAGHRWRRADTAPPTEMSNDPIPGWKVWKRIRGK